jgi:hypothetical protein
LFDYFAEFVPEWAHAPDQPPENGGNDKAKEK